LHPNYFLFSLCWIVFLSKETTQTYSAQPHTKTSK
jgi:hypothetical protein